LAPKWPRLNEITLKRDRVSVVISATVILRVTIFEELTVRGTLCHPQVLSKKILKTLDDACVLCCDIMRSEKMATVRRQGDCWTDSLSLERNRTGLACSSGRPATVGRWRTSGGENVVRPRRRHVCRSKRVVEIRYAPLCSVSFECYSWCLAKHFKLQNRILFNQATNGYVSDKT